MIENLLIPIGAFLLGGLIVLLIFQRRERQLQSHFSTEQSLLRQDIDESQRTVQQLQGLTQRIPELQERLKSSQQQQEVIRARYNKAMHVLGKLDERAKRAEQLDKLMRDVQAQRDTLKDELATLRAELSTEQVRGDEYRQRMEAQSEYEARAQQQLRKDFEALANRIFDDKNTKLSENNQQRLDHLLGPLRQQLGEFKQRVEDVYDKEAQARSGLAAQIEQLKHLNERISQDAINLTNALKGDKKTQGQWGEVILEQVLENSGLRKGYEYEREVVHRTDDGRQLRPDVIIHLPDKRDIVVDAKVSLVAYERAVSSDDDIVRQKAFNEHVAALRQHVRSLSNKSYEQLQGVHSLDYILLFVPIEAAFHAALAQEPDLYNEAYQQNIVLVSPTTLLVTCRTIQNMWRFEHQNQNAQEIAHRAGRMLDKLSGFCDELQKVGQSLGKAQDAYDVAWRRLSSGRGNVLSQAQAVQQLGVSVKRPLPTSNTLLEEPEEEGIAN